MCNQKVDHIIADIVLLPNIFRILYPNAINVIDTAKYSKPISENITFRLINTFPQ